MKPLNNRAQSFNLLKSPLKSVLIFSLTLLSMHVLASEQTISLQQHAGGTLYLDATLDSAINASFLLDTGSSLLTLNEQTFKALNRNKKLIATTKAAARMANGKIVTVSQYRLDSVRIGGHCEVGPVDVSVLPRGSNILGVNALLKAAPLTLTAEQITLSGCLQE